MTAPASADGAQQAPAQAGDTATQSIVNMRTKVAESLNPVIEDPDIM